MCPGLFRDVRWIPPQRGRTSMRPVRGKGDLQAEPPGGIEAEPADHGLGHSRGGLTTKVHLACEQGQKPLPVVITAGQRGDSPQFQVVLDRIRVPDQARDGRGPARTGCWPTRPTAPAPTAATCAGAASPAPSPRKPTRATARTRAGLAAGRPRSTLGSTPSATRPNAASTGSSATGPDALHIYRALFGFLHGQVLNELQELIEKPEENDDLLRLGLHRLPIGALRCCSRSLGLIPSARCTAAAGR